MKQILRVGADRCVRPHRKTYRLDIVMMPVSQETGYRSRRWMHRVRAEVAGCYAKFR